MKKEYSDVLDTSVSRSKGVKTKKSTAHKLDRLLKQQPVPSVLAANFIHTCNKYLTNKKAGNALEAKAFSKLSALSSGNMKMLESIHQAYEKLPAKHKNLFSNSFMQPSVSEGNSDEVTKAYVNEIEAWVSKLALNSW